MKNLLILSCSLLFLNVSAQDHFSGISTSRRVGILNVGVNPAELTNLTSKYEVNLFSTSINISNNKVGFKDLTGDENIEDLIFVGTEPVNMRLDAEFHGPGFAMRLNNKWAFGVSSKAYAKVNIVDINPELGEALSLNSVAGTTTLSNNYNQRLNGTTWGEVGFSAARNLFESEKYKFSAGLTLKLLFPGSYVNLGLDKFNGTIDTNVLGDAYLNDVDNATLNIAYSGNLAGSFTDSSDYTNSLFGSLNGLGADIGFNYQLKDEKGYKLNSGLAIRNLGAMTFKGDNNSATTYILNIPDGTPTEPGLYLNQFDGVDNLEDIEQILLDSGYLDKAEKTNADFKVKLPTVFSAYVDYKVVSSFYVSLYTQQKLGDDSNNNQATTQNVISLTPRFSLKNFEVYVPIASNEISGTTGGFGFRLYGFYLGSGSIITALISDTKQADFHFGYRLGLR